MAKLRKVTTDEQRLRDVMIRAVPSLSDRAVAYLVEDLMKTVKVRHDDASADCWCGQPHAF